MEVDVEWSRDLQSTYHQTKMPPLAMMSRPPGRHRNRNTQIQIRKSGDEVCGEGGGKDDGEDYDRVTP